MCLIVVGWRVHPDFPLVVAANRDEFYARPTALADFWVDVPDIIAAGDVSRRSPMFVNQAPAREGIPGAG